MNNCGNRLILSAVGKRACRPDSRCGQDTGRRRRCVAIPVLALGLAVLSACLTAAWPSRATDVEPDRIYRLLPADAAITFSVEEWGGLQTTQGRFQAFDGTIVLDGLDPPSGRVDLMIDAASVSVASTEQDADWREHELRGVDFFDTAEHPQIRFVSRRLERLDSRRLQLHGDLTIRGITRPASFALLLSVETADAGEAPRLSFSAEGVIDRTGYGMTAWQDVLGRDVQLSISGSARPGPMLPPAGLL